MEITREVAIIILTDPAGRVLMQHRTDDAPIEPGLWTPPGGQLEHGEDAQTAAHRELLEETGLTAVLELLRVVDWTPADRIGTRYHVFAGRTGAGQEDVVLGEGQAMVFLTRAEIATKDLGAVARVLLTSPPIDTVVPDLHLPADEDSA